MAKNDPESQLLRGALIPSFAVGVVAIAIATFAQGKAGLFGALLAQFIVVIFFAVHLFVSRLSTKLDPLSTFALATSLCLSPLDQARSIEHIRTCSLFLLRQTSFINWIPNCLNSANFARYDRSSQFWNNRNCTDFCLARRGNC